MSNILKGLNEGRNYGRDSWDSNMPGYQGDYGGAENFGRRNREWDEDDRIDARIRAEYEQKQEYEKNGKFWLKFKDSQRHLPAGPFIGKQAANTAAIELLKQQPELKGNLLITAYGPDETQGVAEAIPYALSAANANAEYERTKTFVPRGYKGRVDTEVSGQEEYRLVMAALKKLAQDEGQHIETGLSGTKMSIFSKTMGEQALSDFVDIALDNFDQGVAESQLDELSNKTLASYKKKAGADATQADKRGDYARGNKRMGGIIKATKKEFDNDAKGVEEGRYDSGDYYNARQGYEYGARSPSVDSGGYEFDKEVQRNEPGGDRGRPKNIKGVSKSLPPDAFGRTTGKIPAGKTGRIHSMMNDVDEDLDENLHKWFKEKWVRFGPDGKIRGDCARGDDSEGKPKCLPQSKAQNLGKKGRASAAARKRREDPNPERSGKAINVNTKKKSNEGVAEGKEDKIAQLKKDHATAVHWSKNETSPQKREAARQKAEKIKGHLEKQYKQGVAEEQLNELSCWSGYHRVAGTKAGFPGSCAKNKTNESEHSETCPHCGGEMVSEELMNEKKDACYYKVKSRYKVWPSAYASGALVKCRKSGADSWGNGGKKNESIEEDQLDEKWTKKYKDSINCSNPKGFSQKAHCAGKQKNESSILQGLNQLDEGWKEKLGAAALAGSMALGAGGANARVTPDGQGGFTGGLKPTATASVPSDNKPAAEAPKGFSKEYLQKAADPNRLGRYMISVEKAQELLKSMP
jgi:hypothetical protein